MIPELLARRSGSAPLRVWIPACSTGEEAYSIAMLLIEQIALRQPDTEVQIFASDIDEEALMTARRGVYPESAVGDVPEERLRRFFTKTDDQTYQVNKRLRDAIVFAPQNLLGDAPFSKLDLISCRNLLIYLEPGVQKNRRFALPLRAQRGGLFDTGAIRDGWSPDRSLRGHFGTVADLQANWPHAAARGRDPDRRRPFFEVGHGRGAGRLHAGHIAGTRRADAEATDGSVRTGVGADQPQVRGALLPGPHGGLPGIPQRRADPRPAGPGPARSEGPAAALVAQVIQTGEAATDRATRVKRDGHYFPCIVTVNPFDEPRKPSELLLVIFADGQQSPLLASKGDLDREEASLIGQLENELRATREDLQGTIEELESSNEEMKASNEEMMSMNEELQSVNEELETSKEELQSTNEELITVNNQLGQKLIELNAVNNDISNLLNSTDIPTVFLTTDLRIRRFTPSAARLIALLATDLGRPIGDVTRKFTDDRLLDDCRAMLATRTAIEREVRADSGQLLRHGYSHTGPPSINRKGW